MIDTDLLRAICKELLTEKDFERLQELLSLLCALVDNDQEEVEAKLRELSRRYPTLKRTPTPDAKKTRKAVPAIERIFEEHGSNQICVGSSGSGSRTGTSGFSGAPGGGSFTGGGGRFGRNSR